MIRIVECHRVGIITRSDETRRICGGCLHKRSIDNDQQNPRDVANIDLTNIVPVTRLDASGEVYIDEFR